MQIVSRRRGWKEGRTNTPTKVCINHTLQKTINKKKQAAYEKESETGKLKIRRSVKKQTTRKGE